MKYPFRSLLVAAAFAAPALAAFAAQPITTANGGIDRYGRASVTAWPSAVAPVSIGTVRIGEADVNRNGRGSTSVQRSVEAYRTVTSNVATVEQYGRGTQMLAGPNSVTSVKLAAGQPTGNIGRR